MKKQVNMNYLLSRVDGLPPMPAVAQKALALIRDPDSSMSALANILSLDQSLASLVLRWANSAYYGLKNPAATVHQAVTYLGQQTVHNLILAASVSTILDRPAAGYALERGDLWRHSIGTASGARLIATKFGQKKAEEAYTAGLLADIGKLAFEILLREVSVEDPEWKGKPYSDIEKEYFGFDHAQLGAEMASRWNLPPQLLDAISHHHHPSEAKEGKLLACCVHIADIAMMMLGIGLGKDGLQYEIDPVAVETVGWSEESFTELIEKVVPFIDEADAILKKRGKI